MEHKENVAASEQGLHLPDYGVDLVKHSHIVNKEWVEALQPVVEQLNKESVYTIHEKPVKAIHEDEVKQPQNTPQEIQVSDRIDLS